MDKTFNWNGEELTLKTSCYPDGSLAVYAMCPMSFEDTEGNMHHPEGAMEPYATLTVNLDPYTGEKRQDDKHAYLDENNNRNWGVIEFLTEYGLATPTDIVVSCGYCKYRLWEWNTEKF